MSPANLKIPHEVATSPIRCPRWREELIARADAVRTGRGDIDAYVRLLVCEIAVRGWPVRRLVGQDGASAALLLASRAALPYRSSWVTKITSAIDNRAVPRSAAREFLDQVAAERDGR